MAYQETGAAAVGAAAGSLRRAAGQRRRDRCHAVPDRPGRDGDPVQPGARGGARLGTAHPRRGAADPHVDATIARSEAALGRFVLDERQPTGTLITMSGGRPAARSASSNGWCAIIRSSVRASPGSKASSASAAQNSPGRRPARPPRKDSGGVPLFYQAGLSETGPALRRQLDTIAQHERERSSGGAWPRPRFSAPRRRS